MDTRNPLLKAHTQSLLRMVLLCLQGHKEAVEARHPDDHPGEHTASALDSVTRIAELKELCQSAVWQRWSAAVCQHRLVTLSFGLLCHALQ
eukprot:5163618-Amphidinium_carterae.1